MTFPIPEPPWNRFLGLPMTHRFAVFFLHKGLLPNPLDIRFQEVSGLGAKITTMADPCSAPTLTSSRIPTGIEYGDLTLRRGVVTGSYLSSQVETTFRRYTFTRSDVLITTLTEEAIPTGGWLFNEAYPVGWQLADLNAQEENVLVETLQLTYARLRWITL